MSFVAPESLSEQIAGYIAERIIRGEMVSAEHIQEGKVVSHLEVSRGSVREALILLEKRHLVTILPRRGAFVAELTEERIIGLYDLYINLITMLATRVALNWQDDTIPPVLEQAKIVQESARDKDQYNFVEAGFGLMRSAFALANNEYLSSTLEDLQPALQRTYALALRQSAQEVDVARNFFADMIATILARDTDSVPDIVKRYGYHQRDQALSALQSAPDS